jgi:hypothetical protein
MRDIDFHHWAGLKIPQVEKKVSSKSKKQIAAQVAAMEQYTLKNVNNYLNTNIYSYW